jgi:hypothetical protein
METSAGTADATMYPYVQDEVAMQGLGAPVPGIHVAADAVVALKVGSMRSRHAPEIIGATILITRDFTFNFRPLKFTSARCDISVPPDLDARIYSSF